MVEQDTKMKIARADNPDFIRNPTSGRYLRKGSKLHRQLVADGLIGWKRCTEKVIAEDTDTNLRVIKSHIEKGKDFDAEGEKLSIRHGKLYRIRKRMDRDEIVEHTVAHSVGTAVQNRKLMGSKLSDEQLATLLMRVANARIIGSAINLEKDFEDMLRLNDRVVSPTPKNTPQLQPERSPFQSPPPSPPILARQIGQYPTQAITTTPNQISQTRRIIGKKRFIVSSAPVYDTTTDVGETTDFGDTTAYDTGYDDDSEYISD